MNLTRNDAAVAYGFYMAILFIVCAGLVLAVLAPMVNGITTYTNGQIQDGKVSMQTKSAISWNVGAFVWAPIIALICILLWAVVRGLEQKRQGT